MVIASVVGYIILSDYVPPVTLYICFWGLLAGAGFILFKKSTGFKKFAGVEN
jgi:hypothetical protein